MRSRFFIGLLVAVASAVAAAAALAVNLGDAGGVSYRYHASHAAAGHTADSVAACPRGKSPTGGGYALSSGMGFNQYEVAASKPFDGGDNDHKPDDGWEVRGQQPDHGATASSYAICAAGRHLYVAKAAQAEDLSRARVKCPGRASHVIGGGGTLGKPASSTLIASFPIDTGDQDTKPDDGWEAWGYAPVDDKLRAFAVCSHHKPAYHVATETLDPGSGSRVSAECGDGHHLLGVGGRADSAPSQSALVELATPDDLNHDQVYDEAGAIFARNALTAPTAVDSQAYAICTR
jgi:hypothetical protein